jgi:hypothetical protein
VHPPLRYTAIAGSQERDHLNPIACNTLCKCPSTSSLETNLYTAMHARDLDGNIICPPERSAIAAQHPGWFLPLR